MTLRRYITDSRVTIATAAVLTATGAVAALVAHTIPAPREQHAATVAPNAPRAATRVVVIDDRERAFSYAGAWKHVRGRARRYAGTSSLSAQPGAVAVLIFTGTRIALDAVAGPAGGIADIVLDGVRQPQTADFFAPVANRRTVYVSRVLASGRHTLAVVVTARRSRRSRGGYVNIDDARVAVPATGTRAGRSAA